MRAHIDGKEYLISFHHDNPGKRSLFGYTDCDIAEYEPGNPVAVRKVGSFAIKAPGDQYNKEVGRKIALQLTAHKLFPDSKESRRALWIAYLNRARHTDPDPLVGTFYPMIGIVTRVRTFLNKRRG